jgi:transcriptional regulator with XRE-family HTH domain
MLHLPNNIKIIRSLSGKTQEEFRGYFTRVTLAMQKSYEGGKAEPDSLYLQELSELSGVPVNDLMNKEITKKDVKLKVENGENVDGEALPDEKKRGVIMQVVLNLSYSEKKNSNTIEKMAATNQQNSDMIAALLLELLPNSKFAARLAASLSVPPEDDDFAIEDELTEEGIRLLAEQMGKGKKRPANK